MQQLGLEPTYYDVRLPHQVLFIIFYTLFILSDVFYNLDVSGCHFHSHDIFFLSLQLYTAAWIELRNF
jgi:hypothetical protein